MMANWHDLFFKLAFGDTARAAELLALALAKQDSPLLPVGPLRISKAPFVNPELADLYSDLLFEAPSAAAPLLIYILFEHKSTPKHFTLLQLYRYMGEIWALWVEKKAAILPRIIPIIVYQGSEAWNRPLSFHEYFAPSREYSAIGPELHPLFLDIAGIPDERRKRLSPNTRAALAALQHAFSSTPEDLMAALEPLRHHDATSDFLIGLLH